jgi:hypothetical protein
VRRGGGCRCVDLVAHMGWGRGGMWRCVCVGGKSIVFTRTISQ